MKHEVVKCIDSLSHNIADNCGIKIKNDSGVKI